MSKQIALTQGQFAIVDDGDFEFLAQWKWYAHKRPCTFYAERTQIIEGKKQKIWMHRLIMQTPPGMFVDHIDGNGLNNTRSNLRNVTHQQNMANRSLWRNGTTTGVRGVYIDKRDGGIFASITVDGKATHLGRFGSIADASTAYEKARAFLRAGEIYRIEGEVA